MRKKLLVIVMTALIFASACILGFTTVYRVDKVTLYVQAVSDSEEAKSEEQALQESLLDAYKGENLLFSKKTTATEVLSKFPCFRLVKFDKKSPDRIVIEVTEDAEVYAVETEDGYYLLSEDGTTLGKRGDYKNRLDGEDNLLMKGFSVTANRGEIPQNDPAFLAALAFSKEVSALLSGIRKNVLSVERILKTPEGADFPAVMLCFTMKEGVRLYVNQAEIDTEEKANSAIEKYLSLSVEEKTKGAITLLETATAIYSPTDDFRK